RESPTPPNSRLPYVPTPTYPCPETPPSLPLRAFVPLVVQPRAAAPHDLRTHTPCALRGNSEENACSGFPNVRTKPSFLHSRPPTKHTLQSSACTKEPQQRGPTVYIPRTPREQSSNR